METLEQLKAKQAKELAKLEAEHAIAALAPIPPKRAMLVSTGERAWLTYECADLWEALDVMRAYQPIPFNEYRGTFCRYEPEEINERPNNRHKGECASGPYIAEIKADHGEGFGPNASLRFYARLGADVVSVHCDLKRPGYGPSAWWQYAAQFIANPRGRSRRLDGNRYISGDFRANGKLSAMMDKVTTWGTGSAEAAQHSYAISADDESGTWTDAGLRLENIAEAMHGPRRLYRYDFDSQSGTGIIVRLADDLTSLRFTGDDAWRLYNATRYGDGRETLEAEAVGLEFS